MAVYGGPWRWALQDELAALSALLGCGNGADYMEGLLRRLEIAAPDVRDADMDTLVASVNPQRLSNNPMPLDAAALRELYGHVASFA